MFGRWEQGDQNHPVSGQMPGFEDFARVFARFFSFMCPVFDNFCPVWKGRTWSPWLGMMFGWLVGWVFWCWDGCLYVGMDVGVD
jgi:hypothetical protein